MTMRIVHFGSMLLIATLALGQTDKPPAQPSPSQTVGGEVLLNVTFDSKIPQPDLGHFIASRSETAEAARKILNLGEPPQIGVSRTDRGSASLRFSIDQKVKQDARPAVREFAQAIVAALPEQLAAYQQSFVEREVNHARRRLDSATIHLEVARRELKDRREKLRNSTGRIDAVENWADAVGAMEQERHRLTIDLAGQQARRKAIDVTIANVTKQAEARAKDDPIAAELSKILAVRERELSYARTLAKTNDVSEAAVADIETKVADAKSKLLERREMATRSAGGELLTDLNRELLMLSINSAEHEARLKAIQEALDRFREASDDVDALKGAEKELLAQQSRTDAARQAVVETDERYQNVAPPTVSVIDASYVTLEQRPR